MKGVLLLLAVLMRAPEFCLKLIFGLVVIVGASAMSPILPDAKSLAGGWSVKQQGAGSACNVELTLRPLGKGHVAAHDGRCLGGLNLAAVAMWRAAPDGIALAESSGKTAAFFSREGSLYVSRRAGWPVLILSRNPG